MLIDSIMPDSAECQGAGFGRKVTVFARKATLLADKVTQLAVSHGIVSHVSTPPPFFPLAQGAAHPHLGGPC
ncbi:hypothetical protein GRI89_01270 [Altererythrobacter salegens]|uniref:Uncharacterized protein n=1 Tax=Croceibacterium salegens TaxID=1737568 RepID=A0A6I4SQU3_9SPHN|nr:hypothetical protein [Croceibacterium salegens]MXO58175.1 hypothetical protein [Croceibacterium salegens]